MYRPAEINKMSQIYSIRISILDRQVPDVLTVWKSMWVTITQVILFLHINVELKYLVW